MNIENGAEFRPIAKGVSRICSQITLNKRVLCAAALMLAVSGCDWFEDDKAGAAQGTKAQGSVQPGTISDAMIPLDQIRSQSPHESIANLPESEGGLPAPKPSEDGGASDGESSASGDSTSSSSSSASTSDSTSSSTSAPSPAASSEGSSPSASDASASSESGN